MEVCILRYYDRHLSEALMAWESIVDSTRVAVKSAEFWDSLGSHKNFRYMITLHYISV